MNKYFLKWLPVEGEIKIGDMVWDGDNNPPEGDFPYYTVEEEDDIPESHLPDKRVKLFVCTRNIQVGDTLKECMPDGKEYKVHHFEAVLPSGIFVMEPWPSDKEVWITTTKAFKVMGEVSPDAVPFVKEKDEFDESQVKRYIIASDGLAVLPDNWGEALKRSRPDMNLSYMYKLKCPWGHFH